jgi:hypothetical protein
MRMHHDLSPFGPTAAGGSPLDELSVPKRVAHVLGVGLNCSESGEGFAPFEFIDGNRIGAKPKTRVWHAGCALRAKRLRERRVPIKVLATASPTGLSLVRAMLCHRIAALSVVPTLDCPTLRS